MITEPAGVADALVAQRELNSAQTIQKVADRELRKANRALLYYRIRLWAAQKGIPNWVPALIAGSVAAILLPLVSIFVLKAGIAAISTDIVLAYAVFGGGLFILFRDTSAENDDNRVEVRTKQLGQAAAARSRALDSAKNAAMNTAKRFDALHTIEAIVQSDANKRQLATNRLLSVDPGRLYPDEFEHYVAEIFLHLGFATTVTGQSGDQGIDVIATNATLRIAIQAKRHIGAVGNSAVQQAFAGMAHYRCHRCIVVASSEFTPGAIALSGSTGCLLIGSQEMGALIRGEISF